MNSDLFLAILSMDSYNRGYGSGVSGLNETGRLGNATLKAATTEQKSGWESAGFYALSYTIDDASVSGLAAGTTVISYRDYGDTCNNPQTMRFPTRPKCGLPWR